MNKIEKKELLKNNLILAKTFFNLFDVDYNMVIKEATEKLYEYNEIILYHNGEQVGELSISKDGKMHIQARLDRSFLIADTDEFTKDGRYTMFVNYELLNYQNYNKLKGIYKVNNNGKDCKKFLRNKYTVKNSFSIYDKDMEKSYYKFFTVNNCGYLTNRITDEFVSFSNREFNHGYFEAFLHTLYEREQNLFRYDYRYKQNNEELTCAGGVEIYNDLSIKKEAIKVIDEHDNRYSAFIDEQKEEIDSFCDKLFDRSVSYIFTTMSEKEKQKLFNIEREIKILRRGEKK